MPSAHFFGLALSVAPLPHSHIHAMQTIAASHVVVRASAPAAQQRGRAAVSMSACSLSVRRAACFGSAQTVSSVAYAAQRCAACLRAPVGAEPSCAATSAFACASTAPLSACSHAVGNTQKSRLQLLGIIVVSERQMYPREQLFLALLAPPQASCPRQHRPGVCHGPLHAGEDLHYDQAGRGAAWPGWGDH